MKICNMILLIILALLQFRLWFSVGGIQDVRHLEQIKQAQRQENHRLLRRNQALAAEVMDLKHGFAAIEERARSELGLIRQGEVFYRVIEEDQATDASHE